MACPTNSSGTNVPSECSCNAGYSGTVNATSSSPFYTSSCSGIHDLSNLFVVFNMYSVVKGVLKKISFPLPHQTSIDASLEHVDFLLSLVCFYFLARAAPHISSGLHHISARLPANTHVSSFMKLIVSSISCGLSYKLCGNECAIGMLV